MNKSHEGIKQILGKLKPFAGNKIKLIKFEIYRNKEWIDYSLVHPSINKIKYFSTSPAHKWLSFTDENNKSKLFITGLNDFVVINSNGFSVTFDDLNRLRWYKGRGMRLTYEFTNE